MCSSCLHIPCVWLQYGYTALHVACAYDHVEIVRALIMRHGAHIGAQTIVSEYVIIWYGWPMCDNNRCAMVAPEYLFLVTIFRLHILCMWLQGGWTALHVACANGHAEVVNALITQHNAQVETITKVSEDVILLYGWSMCVVYRSVKVVRMIVVAQYYY